MNWLDDRMSQLPTQAGIDSTYFHIAMLIVAGLLLAFSLVGGRIHPQSRAKCGMGLRTQCSGENILSPS